MTNKELKQLLKGFPNNATMWGEATDEIRDLAKRIREAVNAFFKYRF